MLEIIYQWYGGKELRKAKFTITTVSMGWDKDRKKIEKRTYQFASLNEHL